MGEDLVNSMVEGVIEAACLVAFMSPSYKGSSNCRGEMDLARNLKKPIVFVNVMADYKPDGWLLFYVGQSRWVNASDPTHLGDWSGEILSRSQETFNVKPDHGENIDEKRETTVGVTTATSAQSDNADELTELVKTLMGQVTALTGQVAALQQRAAKMETQQLSSAEKLDKLLANAAAMTDKQVFW